MAFPLKNLSRKDRLVPMKTDGTPEAQTSDAPPAPVLPDDYRALRDRLAALLRSILCLETLDGPHRRTLSAVLTKVLEDQFRFVLAGEFQCGKSTTFNALCDGRELSPRGMGIKTSGCVVSASHLSDPRTAPFATVQWRTASELGPGMAGPLYAHLRRLSPARFGRGPEGNRTPPDPDDPEDLRLLKAAARAEWAAWERDRAGYDPDRLGHLDVLRCATLIARYWADDRLTRLRNRETFSPSETAAFMTFPVDWEERWMAGDPDAFSMEEVIFLFVRAVRLHIHSPHLSRLGCVAVDCPGLYASRWDTQSARAAMADADAILYVFDGSRPLKRSDLRALEFIRANDMDPKLFYGCNLRGLSAADSHRVLAASLASLEKEGFSAPPERVAAFHARLGLISARAQRECLAPEGKTDGDGAELLAAIRNTLSAMGIDAPEGADARSAADAVALARRASGLDRLMGMAETAVVRRKARSILVDNGAHIGLDILREAAGTLLNREKTARLATRAFQDQVAEAETALRRFEGRCRLAVDRLDDGAPDAAMAEDLWGRLIAAREEMCDHCAGRIRKEVLTRRNLAALVLRRKVIEDGIIRILQSEMEERFEAIIHGWLSEVREGRNPVYNLRIARQVETVSQELKRIWSASGLGEMEMLSGVALPSFTGVPAVERERLFREMADREILNDLRNHALTAASLAGIFTAASGLLAGVVGALSRVFWAAVASAAVLVVNGLILLLTKGMIKETLQSEIRSRLSPAFIQIFDDIQPEIIAAFTDFSAGIRTLYRNAFMAAIEKPRALFEERRQRAEADFRQHREGRDAAAREARRIRKEKIEPLVGQLEGFIKEVDSLFDENIIAQSHLKPK